jgi:signal transduction histidine kinase
MATVLIVDDRADNREFLVTLLGYAGHQLLEASNAVEALEFARGARPELVITDILMPEIDGFELVRRMRAEPAIAHTRVIFYSATYLEAEMRALARSLGVDNVIVKPAEPHYILELVQSALSLDEPAPRPPSAAAFARDHQRLLLDKLTQKTNELEAINADLERRVQERTAELAAANERLRELNGLKDDLLVIASHDLRSPLGSIQVMADMLLEEDYDLPDDPHRLFLGHIRSAAQHLIGLVVNLLDLSKIESGRVELDCFDLRASELVHQVIEGLNASAVSKSIALKLVIAPGEPLVSADRMKLTQIFSNLLSNAIKFTPRGGCISVAVIPEAGRVRVDIADNGLGIAPEYLPHLFEKFQRAHIQGTAGEKGSGLGLAIVRQLVDLHGGSIEVASEVGGGSTFTVHLPVSAASE